jgi:hypothetical protein
MMMKLKMGGTLAKAFAKKHYAGAMDAMKTLKGKLPNVRGAGAFQAKAMTKAKGFGTKIKKQSKKFYKKNPILNKSDVAFIKQNPGISAAGAGIGAVAGAGLGAIGEAGYNLASGQRNVRVRKKTAKQIRQMRKTYNI